jgi:Fe-S-cluster containining protein
MITLKSNPRILPIRSIDKNIFTARYFTHCMQFGCEDICCSYGCPLDLSEVDRLTPYQHEIERRTNHEAAMWFQNEVEANSDYPSGYVKNTMVYNGRCVFHAPTARGCLLHIMALEKGLDPHQLKPMVCFLFPLTWDGSYLHVADFLEELPCQHKGELILDSIIDEIRYYLGEDTASEILQLKAHAEAFA